MAQENVVIIGKVVGLKSNKGIENVHVKVNQRNILVKSDKNGFYKIALQKKMGFDSS